MSKKKRKEGFAVGQCSCCEMFRLTFGQQTHGGVRWCADCFTLSLAYVQLSDEERTRFMNIWRGAEQEPKVQALLELSTGISDDVRKSMAIGESRYRLMTAEREE